MIKLIHRLAVVLTICIVIPAVAFSAPVNVPKDRQPQSPHNEETAASQNITTADKNSAFVAEPVNVQAVSDSNGNQKPNDTDEKFLGLKSADWTNWFQAISAVAVAFMTFFLWRLSKKQTDIMGKNAEDTAGAIAIAKQSADAAVTAANATNQSAIAAIRAANVAEKALTHIEAAFVFMEEYGQETLWHDKEVYGYHVLPRWRNTGSTPAKNISSHVNLFRGEQFPQGFDFPDLKDPDTPQLERPRSIIFIGPQATALESEVYVGRTEDTPDYAENIGFIYGWIEYDDVFSSKRRRTEFCHRFKIDEPRDGRGKMTSGQLIFHPYGRFNGMDGDCFRTPTTKSGQQDE